MSDSSSSYPKTLYDKGDVRITSSLLKYKDTQYRIRDIYKIRRIKEETKEDKSSPNFLLIFVIILVFTWIFQSLFSLIIATMISLILLLTSKNNPQEKASLIITTNKAEEIKITQEIEEIDQVQKNLEKAIDMLSYQNHFID